MIRGRLRYDDDEGLVAIVDQNEDYYFVDFFENGSKIGTINYYGKDGSYAESAAENYIYGIFKKEDVLKHIEQLELEF